MKVSIQHTQRNRVVTIEEQGRAIGFSLAQGDATPADQLKKAAQTLVSTARDELARANVYERAAAVLGGADAPEEPAVATLRDLIANCRDALDAMHHQLHQLQGLVDDDDGEVQSAIDKGDQALALMAPCAIELMLTRSPEQAAGAADVAADVAADSGPVRSEQQIVDETEKLAAMLMSWAHMRETSSDGGGYTYRDATDPRGKSCWLMACQIQEFLTQTDPENAVAEIDG